MPFVTNSQGKQIWYDVVGEGAPLVLVGGSSLVRRQWDFMVPLLKDRFKVVLYDQRGAGLSDRTPEGISLEGWVDDLKLILDALGVKKTYIFGTSNGSYIVIRFAAKYGDRTAAIAHYGMYKVTEQSKKMWKVGAAICDEFGVGNGSMGAYFLVRLFGMPTSHESWEVACFEENLSPEAWKAMHRAMQVDLSEDVRSIAAPQLLLVGDSGPLGKDSDYGSGWKAIREMNPQIELALIPGAEGTYCVVTHPEAVTAAIVRFFERHPVA